MSGKKLSRSFGKQELEIKSEIEDVKIETDKNGNPVLDPDVYATTETGPINESKIQEFHSHLFKLHVGEVLRQTGPNNNIHEDPDSFTLWEHTHPFRTRDSNGNQLARSSSIAGHFHKIEMKPDPRGKDFPPIITKVGPPMTFTRKKVKGKWQMVEIPTSEHDQHTHKVQYLRSDIVKARTTNIEAAKVMAWEANKGKPPEGASEG